MKKEKHNLKKYSSLLLLALIMAGSVCGCSKLESQKQTETELAAGQRKAKLQVVSITGNELTYIEETEAEKDSELAADSETEMDSELVTDSETEGAPDITEDSTETEIGITKTEKGQQKTEVKTQMQAETSADQKETKDENTGSFGGQMPQMDQQNGSQMPQMDQADGKQMPAMPTVPSEEDSSSGRSMPDFFASAAETVTVYLPVSVKVHIGSGKTADFSILEAGDQLEVLFEENEKGEEIITEIWLISTN